MLGIDTAGPMGLVFVGNEQKVFAAVSFPREAASEKITRAVGDALETAAQPQERIEAVVVNPGPGSLTGIKVGLSFARTFCQVRGKPLVGVSALDALAYSLNVSARSLATPAGPPPVLLPMMKAVRGEIYYAFYSFSLSCPTPVETDVNNSPPSPAGKNVGLPHAGPGQGHGNNSPPSPGGRGVGEGGKSSEEGVREGPSLPLRITPYQRANADSLIAALETASVAAGKERTAPLLFGGDAAPEHAARLKKLGAVVGDALFPTPVAYLQCALPALSSHRQVASANLRDWRSVEPIYLYPPPVQKPASGV